MSVIHYLEIMFGSGGSHILKFNRNQVQERRSFKSISNAYHESDRIIAPPKLSPSQLERLRTELKEKRRRESYMKALVLFLILFSVVTVFILILR